MDHRHLLVVIWLLAVTPVHAQVLLDRVFALYNNGPVGLSFGSTDMDTAENLYIVVKYMGELDLDPGPGAFTVASYDTTFMESSTAFAKFDQEGNFIIGKNFPDTVSVSVLKASNDGHVYVAGRFPGTVDFDLGSDSALFTAIGPTDLFLACYDDQWELVWVRTFGSTGPQNDLVFDMTLDATSVYITGNFHESMMLGTGNDELILTSSIGPSGQVAFMAKFTLDGDPVWGKALNGNDDSFGYAIDIGPENVLLLAGYFKSTLDMDPGPGVTNLTAPQFHKDIFFATYDTSGTLIWAKSLSNCGNTLGLLRAVFANDGSIFLAGDVNAAADLDPGPDILSYMYNGGGDIILGHYDANGDLLWAHQFGGNFYEHILGLAVDLQGRAYITGHFRSDLFDLDPAPGPATLQFQATNAYDLFIAQYDPQGNLNWAHQLPLVDNASGYFVFPYGENEFHFVGEFVATGDFGFDGMPHVLAPAPYGRHVFVAKYSLSDLTTFVDDLDFNRRHNLFPNPTFDRVYLPEQWAGQEQEVVITDLAGRTQHVPMIPVINAMDVSQLPAGIYLVKMMQEGLICHIQRIQKL